MKKINTLGIITARKGSKRIKNKSLKLFYGKPVIYYSIKNLQKSKIFDEIIVSTNCDLIEKVSRDLGVKKIIRRPNYLSSNKVGTISVINHSINTLSKFKTYPKYVCCIYPAAPLTRFENIKSAYKWIKNSKTGSGFIYPSTIISNKKNNLKYNQLFPLLKIKKKEGIANDVLLDAGQFWFAKSSTWKKAKTIYQKNSYSFLIEEKISDINSINDWKKVEIIFGKNRKKYIS